jgi:isocitrate dehydrogenase kinase/phosphatase
MDNNGCQPWNAQREVAASEIRLKYELQLLHQRVGRLERTNEQLVKGFEALLCAVSELIKHHHPHVPLVESLNLEQVKA